MTGLTEHKNRLIAERTEGGLEVTFQDQPDELVGEAIDTLTRLRFVRLPATHHERRIIEWACDVLIGALEPTRGR